MTTWREFLIEIVPKDIQFFPPVDIETLKRTEAKLKVVFPTDLRSLLLESNGLYDADSMLKLVWSIEEIEKENLAIRADSELADLYMTFESLLFFARAGVDGILFAFPITATGRVEERNIIVWYPIEDSRPVLAFSLKDYLKRWTTSELNI